MILLGLDVNLGADGSVEDGGEVDEATALLGEDLKLSNDVGHFCELLSELGDD